MSDELKPCPMLGSTFDQLERTAEYCQHRQPCPQCAEKDARLERVRELRQALHDESDGEGSSIWCADRLDAALAATEAGDAERDAEQGVG